MVAGQRIQVGFGHAGQTVTVASIGDIFHVYDGDLLLVQVANTTTSPSPGSRPASQSRPAQHPKDQEIRRKREWARLEKGSDETVRSEDASP